LYEYRCKKCNRVFEVIQKFADEPLTVDEQCGGEVERLISAPGLHFKGSGWYVTDYARAGAAAKSDGAKNDGKTESSKNDSGESGKKESGKKESSSESKPAETKSTTSTTSSESSS